MAHHPGADDNSIHDHLFHSLLLLRVNSWTVASLLLGTFFRLKQIVKAPTRKDVILDTTHHSPSPPLVYLTTTRSRWHWKRELFNPTLRASSSNGTLNRAVELRWATIWAPWTGLSCLNLRWFTVHVCLPGSVPDWPWYIHKFGFINRVDNVNWPPYRDSKSWRFEG